MSLLAAASEHMNVWDAVVIVAVLLFCLAMTWILAKSDF